MCFIQNDFVMKSMKLFWCMCMVLTLGVAIESTVVDDVKLEPLPNNASYASDDMTYEDGGMAPLNNFARSFINSALPGGFDEAFVEGTFITNTTSSIPNLIYC